MPDIAQRLRHIDDAVTTAEYDLIITEAADEIERLRAALDYATKHKAHVAEAWVWDEETQGHDALVVKSGSCSCCEMTDDDVPDAVRGALVESYHRNWG